MFNWIASIGVWDENGNPKYRAYHFEAEDIAKAVKITDQQLSAGEYLYEIRMRKGQGQ